MGIIKILFHGRPPLVRRAPVDAARKRATPIHSVRRKFLLRGTEYSVTLKPVALRNGLTLQEQTMVVALHPPTRENFEQFMTGWYRRQARQAYEEAISRWLPQFHAAGYPLPPPRLKIFAMRRAWGRCYYTKGLITMNLHLVKSPIRASTTSSCTNCATSSSTTTPANSTGWSNSSCPRGERPTCCSRTSPAKNASSADHLPELLLLARTTANRLAFAQYPQSNFPGKGSNLNQKTINRFNQNPPVCQRPAAHTCRPSSSAARTIPPTAIRRQTPYEKPCKTSVGKAMAPCFWPMYRGG